MLPNKACSGRVGFSSIFKHFAYAWLRVFPAPKQNPRPPQRTPQGQTHRVLRERKLLGI